MKVQVDGSTVSSTRRLGSIIEVTRTSEGGKSLKERKRERTKFPPTGLRTHTILNTPPPPFSFQTASLLLHVCFLMAMSQMPYASRAANKKKTRLPNDGASAVKYICVCESKVIKRSSPQKSIKVVFLFFSSSKPLPRVSDVSRRELIIFGISCLNPSKKRNDCPFLFFSFLPRLSSTISHIAAENPRQQLYNNNNVSKPPQR